MENQEIYFVLEVIYAICVLLSFISALMMKILICLYVMMNLIQRQTLAFMPLWSKSKRHQDITRDAILQTTADVCRLQALQDRRDFLLVNKIVNLFIYHIFSYGI